MFLFFFLANLKTQAKNKYQKGGMHFILMEFFFLPSAFHACFLLTIDLRNLLHAADSLDVSFF